MRLNFEEIMRAFVYADQAHSGQLRAGTEIPAIQHPRQVGILCLMHTYDQELGIAGFLHDVVDTTAVTPEDIRERFGERVADIVAACSEQDRSLSWKERKSRTIASLRHASRDVKVVVCADKLHDLLTMLEEHELAGERYWEHFEQGREEQERYYRELVESIGSDGVDKEELHWFLEAAVDCLFGAVAPHKEAFLLQHLQWLRGPNRLGMIYCTDRVQRDVSDLAMFGEKVYINVCSPVKVHIAFDPKLHAVNTTEVGFVDDQHNSLLRIDIDDRTCKFLERYYDDILALVHEHTCMNLNYFAGIIEDHNLFGLEPGHYLVKPTDDGLDITFNRIDDRSRGEYIISLAFDDYGEQKPASELSRGVAKFFFYNLLKNEELAECFIGVRTEANGLTLTREMPLTPLPEPEQVADQTEAHQVHQEGK